MRMAPTILLLSVLSGPILNGPVFAQAVASLTAAPTPPPPGFSALDKRALTRVDDHIRDLHGRLVITPAQEPLWADFTAIMRQNALAMEHSHRDQQATGTPSAVTALRGYATLSRLHADNVDRLLPAFEALYNTLSPDQRTTADHIFQAFQNARFGVSHS